MLCTLLVTQEIESTKFPEKYYENNFEKPKKFFDVCIKNNLNKFIFSSTGSVYGNVSMQKNIPEDYKKKSPKSLLRLKI